MEIAGIIVGTLLVFPIPVLALTGSYKRLARLTFELNNNISVEGKINGLANQFMQNKDKILGRKLKEFEEHIDADLLQRLEGRPENEIKVTILIEVRIKNRNKNDKILYEFHYNKNQLALLNKVLKENDLTAGFFHHYTQNDLQNVNFVQTVTFLNERGKGMGGYYQGRHALDLDPF
jgi:hypothetical protein